ncbi:MAG: conserved hypothetical phage tail region protein [Clostridia bacterium]|jgi:phage tail-like protein|nr:conserved hypothetical phage tail region protein [Clostridia bacterium]
MYWNTLFASAIENRIRKASGYRPDPYLAYNFLVEFDGIYVGGFTEVSGLGIDIEVERKRFGGENDREYAFVTQAKYSDITLKRGLISQGSLWNWCENVSRGIIQRKNGSICLLDHSGRPAVWWDFYDAFPIKWEGPTFNAAGSSVAIESLVFAHLGLNMY